MIPKNELIPGAIYRINARNFTIAIWTGAAFRGAREKFGHVYLFDEFSWEDGPPFGTATALERLGERVIPSPWESDTILALLEVSEILYYRYSTLDSAVAAAGYDVEMETSGNWTTPKLVAKNETDSTD